MCMGLHFLFYWNASLQPGGPGPKFTFQYKLRLLHTITVLFYLFSSCYNILKLKKRNSSNGTRERGWEGGGKCVMKQCMYEVFICFAAKKRWKDGMKDNMRVWSLNMQEGVKHAKDKGME